jgi:GNAT superfamily N-acetyltransferase
VTSDTRRILSSLTLIGPLPPPDDVEGCLSQGPAEGAQPLRWAVNGVWTHPEARRKGIGRAVMSAAQCWASREAAREGREWLLTTQAFETNVEAVAFYRRAGFTESGAGEPGLVGLKLKPTADHGARAMQLSNEGGRPVS